MVAWLSELFTDWVELDIWLELGLVTLTEEIMFAREDLDELLPDYDEAKGWLGLEIVTLFEEVTLVREELFRDVVWLTKLFEVWVEFKAWLVLDWLELVTLVE